MLFDKPIMSVPVRVPSLYTITADLHERSYNGGVLPTEKTSKNLANDENDSIQMRLGCHKERA